MILLNYSNLFWAVHFLSGFRVLLIW